MHGFRVGCQDWLSKLVVKILVIVSSSASSVMFWHFFYKGDSLEIINLLLQSCLTRLLAMVVLDIAKGATNPRCECLCQSCLFKLQTSTIRYKQLQAVIKRFPSLFKLKRQLWSCCQAVSWVHRQHYPFKHELFNIINKFWISILNSQSYNNQVNNPVSQLVRYWLGRAMIGLGSDKDRI